MLLELGLCVAINVLTIRKVRSTPGADLEWKLLIGAAAVDAIYLLLEGFFCVALAERKLVTKRSTITGRVSLLPLQSLPFAF